MVSRFYAISIIYLPGYHGCTIDSVRASADGRAAEMSEQPEFIKRITTVGTASVLLYSLDGEHRDSSTKLLLKRGAARDKEMRDLRKSWRSGTRKKVIG